MDSDNRNNPRRKSKTEATVRIGNGVIRGRLLDTSEEGVFFRPDWGIVDGSWDGMEKPTDSLRVAEKVMVTFQQGDEIAEREAVIRWVGCSNWHWSHGAGLLFEGDN